MPLVFCTLVSSVNATVTLPPLVFTLRVSPVRPVIEPLILTFSLLSNPCSRLTMVQPSNTIAIVHRRFPYMEHLLFLDERRTAAAKRAQWEGRHFICANC